MDLIASFFTAAALAFAVAGRAGGGAAVWTCLAAAALAVGTKTQTMVIAFPAAAFAVGTAVRSGRRLSWRSLAAVVALVGALAAVGPVQNQLRFGSPHGFASVAWLISDPGMASLAKNVQLVLAPLNPTLEASGCPTGGRSLGRW